MPTMGHPTVRLIQTVQASGIVTWWDHSREVMLAWGVNEEAGVGCKDWE